MKNKAQCEICGRRAKFIMVKNGIKRCIKHGMEIYLNKKQNKD